MSDFKSGAPKEWREDGYFFPMYRQEAMWINFKRGYMELPRAMIIGAGNINAISGKPFDPSKNRFQNGNHRKKSRKKNNNGDGNGSGTLEIKLEKEQNYLVVPPQPWIDGWKAEDGKVYQFVAAEMGSGETVEGQITGEETVGGVQFIVYEPREDKKLVVSTRPHEYIIGGSWDSSPILVGGMSLGGCFGSYGGSGSSYGLQKSFFASAKASPSNLAVGCAAGAAGSTIEGPVVRGSPAAMARRVTAMGLGRGGEIEQKIYPDPYGVEVWQEKPKSVEVVYMVSSEDFKQITGYDAPPTPVTYEKYQQLGLPWFELHDKKYGDSKGSHVFEKLKPVEEGKAKVPS